MNLRTAFTATTIAIAASALIPLTMINAETVSAPTTVATTSTTSTTSTTTSTTSTTTTTIVATSTVVPLGFDPVCGEPLMRLALEVGWAHADLPRLDAVARRESGGDCGNTDVNMSNNPHDPRYCGGDLGSLGTLQINSYWAAPTRWNGGVGGWLGKQGILTDCTQLFDVRTNLIAGLAIFRHSGGWGPWGG